MWTPDSLSQRFRKDVSACSDRAFVYSGRVQFLFVSHGKQESGEECGRLPAEPVKDHGNGNGTDIEKPSADDEADSVGEGLYQCYGYFLFQKL